MSSKYPHKQCQANAGASQLGTLCQASLLISLTSHAATRCCPLTPIFPNELHCQGKLLLTYSIESGQGQPSCPPTERWAPVQAWGMIIPKEHSYGCRKQPQDSNSDSNSNSNSKACKHPEYQRSFHWGVKQITSDPRHFGPKV